MAAVITSVVPTPGFFANATVVINGTGFGASPGNVYMVFPDEGIFFISGIGVWSATSVTGIVLPVNGDEGIVLPTSIFFVVQPLGSDVGARSAVFTLSDDPTPITSFPNNTLIVAGPTATAEGNQGPQPPPPTFPLRGALGRTSQFDNPGYDVKWVEFNTQNQDYEAGLDGFTQTDFSVVGASVQTNLEHLGIFIPTF